MCQRHHVSATKDELAKGNMQVGSSQLRMITQERARLLANAPRIKEEGSAMMEQPLVDQGKLHLLLRVR